MSEMEKGKIAKNYNCKKYNLYLYLDLNIFPVEFSKPMT